MALIRTNGGAASAAGKVLETKSFTVTAAQSASERTTVTLDNTYSNGKYALEITSGYDDSCAVGIESVSGASVQIKLRNYYSSSRTVTGNVIVFE